jgi:hypothetical protein
MYKKITNVQNTFTITKSQGKSTKATVKDSPGLSIEIGIKPMKILTIWMDDKLVKTFD